MTVSMHQVEAARSRAQRAPKGKRHEARVRLKDTVVARLRTEMKAKRQAAKSNQGE